MTRREPMKTCALGGLGLLSGGCVSQKGSQYLDKITSMKREQEANNELVNRFSQKSFTNRKEDADEKNEKV